MALASLMLGCSDPGGPYASPVTPTTVQTPPTAQTPPTGQTPVPSTTLYSLSGVIFEVTSAGTTPVEGVEVYCESCGPPLGHSGRFTGTNGFYSFDGGAGAAAGVVEVMFSKPGYVLPNQPDQSGPDGLGWMGSVNVRITADTRYDVQITRK